MSNLVTTQDAVVARGQQAWTTIKATAAEQRELWRQIGEALNVGRWANKSNQAFGKWLKDNGFDDLKTNTRADAMWYASVFGVAVLRSADNDLTHPTQMRKAYNEQQKTRDIPEDLLNAPITVTPRVTMDNRTAAKVGKLERRAKSGDEGSEIAERQMKATAAQHGVTPEELREAAAVQEPKSFYQFTPDQLEMLEDFTGNVMATVGAMERGGITREAIAHVFMNAAQKIIQGEAA